MLPGREKRCCPEQFVSDREEQSDILRGTLSLAAVLTDRFPGKHWLLNSTVLSFSENNRQKFCRSVIQSLHSMRIAGIEIQGITRIKDEFMIVDQYLHRSFQDIIEFLAGMAVKIHRGARRLRLNSHKEGFRLLVHEVIGQMLV
jgi:hypothetical protein